MSSPRLPMPFLAGLVLGSALLPTSRAAAPPSVPALPGDPLPPGAVARLGTVRLRHSTVIQSIGFTRDGNTLASLSYDGLRLWDPATGRELRRLAEYGGERAGALSPDGKVAALVSSRAIHLVETATGRE